MCRPMPHFVNILYIHLFIGSTGWGGVGWAREIKICLKGPVDNFFALTYQYEVNVECTV